MSIDPNSEPSVLAFQAANLIAPAPRYDVLHDVNLSLRTGECAIIETPSARELLPLASAAQGLLLANLGSVSYLGHTWNDREPNVESRLRGSIGRVFGGWGWVSNLSVIENVTLSQRHHTSRSDTDIENEADELAKTFDMPQVPRGRPVNVAPDSLRRSEWVRAFLGNPKLLLLEHPMRDVPWDRFESLATTVRKACDRGAAVCWLTDDVRVVGHASLRTARRFEVVGSQLRSRGVETP